MWRGGNSAPLLRATLMAAIVVLGGFFLPAAGLCEFRGAAALTLLWRSRCLRIRASMSFLALLHRGLAAPWLERTVQPYMKRCAAGGGHADAATNLRGAFRIDLRSWRDGSLATATVARQDGRGLAAGRTFLTFRAWELLVSRWH